MAPLFSGVRQKTWFSFFRRDKTVREIISSAGDIQENLDWGMNDQIHLSISSEASSEHFDATIVNVDHSPIDAYIQLRASRPKEALPVLKRRESLVMEYKSNRANRFRFQSYPLTEIDTDSGEMRVGYPSLIESIQDLDATRLKNAWKDPIPVDVERQRGVVVDLGLHGLKFTCNQIFETGKLLKDLQIDLPRLGPVQGSAVVKYMQPSKDYPLWRYLCGVEFTDMKPRDQRKLNRYVNRVLKQG